MLYQATWWNWCEWWYNIFACKFNSFENSGQVMFELSWTWKSHWPYNKQFVSNIAHNLMVARKDSHEWTGCEWLYIFCMMILQMSLWWIESTLHSSVMQFNYISSHDQQAVSRNCKPHVMHPIPYRMWVAQYTLWWAVSSCFMTNRK